jgi:hypothetical protein
MGTNNGQRSCGAMSHIMQYMRQLQLADLALILPQLEQSLVFRAAGLLGSKRAHPQ